MPVWHGPKARDPVIWVVEFGDPAAGTHRKLILAWDMLHLVPRYPGDDADAAYRGPVAADASPFWPATTTR